MSVTTPQIHFELVSASSFGGTQITLILLTFFFLVGSIVLPGMATHFLYRTFDWVETAAVRLITRIIDLVLPGDQSKLFPQVDEYIDRVAAVIAKPIFYILSHVIGSTFLEVLALICFAGLVLHLFAFYITGSFSVTQTSFFQ